MPVVSAIITTFNRVHYVEKAIRSVLAQGYTNFELLVLDNSSIDETESVVHQFTDNRIRYIKHSPLNISETRNLGVREAKGDYIAFLDDDDEWLPDKLASELSLFEQSNSDVALVYGGFIRIDTHGRPFFTHIPSLSGKILKGLLSLKDEFTGSASNPMIKKAAIEALGGFDETVKTGEDWEFYLRLAERYQVAFVGKPVVNIRHHHGVRLGDRLKDYIDLELKVMQRFKTVFNADNKLKSFYLQRMGGKYLRLGDTSKGRSCLIDAVKCRATNYLAYVQYILSFFPKSAYSYFHRLYLNRIRSIKI